LLALGGKAVLVGARHAALAGDVLGRLAHVPALEGAPQAVVDHGVHRLLVPILPAGAGPEQQVRRPAHALHAAGYQQVGVASAHRYLPIGVRTADRITASGMADFLSLGFTEGLAIINYKLTRGANNARSGARAPSPRTQPCNNESARSWPCSSAPCRRGPAT